MKKEIIFYVKKLECAGAERILITYLKELKKYDVDIKLFILIKTGGLLSEIPKHVKVSHAVLGNEYFNNSNNIIKKVYGLYRKLILKTLTKFKFLINLLYLPKTSDIEVCFLQDFSHTIFYSRNRRSKKVVWVHNNINRIRSITLPDLIKNLHRADNIITVSNGIRESIVNYDSSLKDKVETIYNPINALEILPMSKMEQIELKGYSFITLGRLEEQKGHDLLIRAFSQINGDYPETYLYILGKGNKEKELNRLIKDLNLTNHVFLLGLKSNPFPYLKAADTMVLSSRYEGFSNVLVESLILNKPIVSTDCLFGPKEVLKGGDFGILVEPENIESLKNGMIKMMNNKMLRESFIQKSQERAMDFSVSNIVSQFTHKVGITICD